MNNVMDKDKKIGVVVPAHVVGGINKESAHRAVELYKTIVRKEISATNTSAAEMSKGMENAYGT